MTIDLHTHSDNSPDGGNSVIELCESAVSKEISYIAITDHCEIDSFLADRYDIGVRQSFFETQKAKSVFSGQINILTGIELGQATADRGTASRVITALPYDVVLGSLHRLKGVDDFAFINYDGVDVKSLFSRYLDELLELAEQADFDVLTHLTYPLRYINGEQGNSLETEDFGGQIEKILRSLAQRGKALEINTSGLRQAYGKTMPDLFCVRLFKAVGGEFVTTGSDSHTATDIGAGIKSGTELAAAAGFDRLCYFVGRKPVCYNISNE